MLSKSSSIKTIIVNEDMTTIRIMKSTRNLLQDLKGGNSKRNKGIDTYDDVILRLVKYE